MPDQSDFPDDLQREIERLRRELERADRDRIRLERERDRLRRENERLQQELDLARRAAKRAGGPVLEGARRGVIRAGRGGDPDVTMDGMASGRGRRRSTT